MAAMKKPPTMSALKWDIRVATRKLKKLGVVPPPPKGKPAMQDVMKPGKFYAMPRTSGEVSAYLGQLRALLDGQASKWTADAFLHTVLAAALKAAPEGERLERPHGHVAAKPVINNRGYLGAALLAAEHVGALVPEAERKAFHRLEELGRRVLAGKEMTSEDEAVLNREAPHVWQPSGAHWLVKLANGRFALLWKVKGKWRLVEGSREDAIASVPDAHLKDAVAAMAASSGR